MPTLLPGMKLSKPWLIYRQELLGIEQVGIQDNFFELGDTLLAVRLFAQIKKIFGLELPVANLFQAPHG